jgi:hypothetical protein
LPPQDAEWVYRDHEQGRAYAKAADVAWDRINGDDETDLPHAIDDFARCTEGLVKMFAYHAEREDNYLFPEMGRYLSASNDGLIMHVITQIGPRTSRLTWPLLWTWNRRSASGRPIRLLATENRPVTADRLAEPREES